MNELQELIDESKRLEELASQIQQGNKIGLPKEDYEKLLEDYEAWYFECLDTLPEAAKEAFRTQYVVSIQKFLETPTETEAFPMPDAPFWLYPYEYYFRQPISEQRAVLEEISQATRKKP